MLQSCGAENNAQTPFLVTENASRRNMDLVIEHAGREKFDSFSFAAPGSYAYGQYAEECAEFENLSNLDTGEKFQDTSVSDVLKH